MDDLPAKVNEIGLQVCLVPSRCPPEAPERSFEAAPLVPLQMTALSCLVIVRKLGALEDVARELGLETFEEDEEIGQKISRLQNENSKAILYTSKKIFDRMSMYNNICFRERLKEIFDICAN